MGTESNNSRPCLLDGPLYAGGTGHNWRLTMGLALLVIGTGCVMAPMGSLQQPRTVPKGQVAVGMGAAAAPLAFGADATEGMLLGELDLWLDVGTGARRDVRVRLTAQAIWEDPAGRASPTLLMAGATAEGKLANSTQTSAFLIGTTFWVPFVDSSLFTDSMSDSGSHREAPANYQPFYPWATFNVGHTHELAAFGDTRLLITSWLNTIFILYLGATFHTSLSLHVPLGDSIALRPEIFAAGMVLSTYMANPSRFFLWGCGGGAALGIEF